MLQIISQSVSGTELLNKEEEIIIAKEIEDSTSAVFVASLEFFGAVNFYKELLESIISGDRRYDSLIRNLEERDMSEDFAYAKRALEDLYNTVNNDPDFWGCCGPDVLYQIVAPGL